MLSLIVTIYMIFCRDAAHFRGIAPESDATFLGGFINRLYFVVSTFTTIGFGDVAPATRRARVLTIVLILAVFTVILKAFTSIIDTYDQTLKKYVQAVAGAPKAAVNAVRGAAVARTAQQPQAKAEEARVPEPLVAI